jgi:hypothetical protein
MGVLYVRGHRTAEPQSWAPWVGVGGLLSVASLVTVAVLGDRELSAAAWLALMGALLVGLSALATGLVLVVQRSSRRVALQSE